MTIKKFYIGPFGPYEYEDTDNIDDPDGDFSGETQQSLATTGTMIVDGAPTSDNHVIRLSELNSSSSTYANRLYFMTMVN